MRKKATSNLPRCCFFCNEYFMFFTYFCVARTNNNLTYMVKMKRLFLLCAFVSMFATCNFISAQKELGIFNSLSAGVGVGLTGVDVEIATPITPYLALRGGVSIMPNFSLTTDVDVDVDVPEGFSVPRQIDLTGSMKRTSGQLLVNVYPFTNKSSFFVTAGAYFGGSSLVKIKGHSDELKDLIAQGQDAGIAIGDYMIPVDKNGDVAGGLKVSGFRPYLGLGFGRAVPKKRLGVMFELGVQFHGRPEVYTDYGNVQDLLNELDEDDTFTKIIDKLTVYPVMKIRLCGRIF